MEVLNAKYAVEIKKDQEKKARFLYSKFSPVAECIKDGEDINLKEILKLVQTNLIKIYVELKEKDKIY